MKKELIKRLEENSKDADANVKRAVERKVNTLQKGKTILK